ncbi:MAG: hypothetical protein AAGD43_35615 [Pseudomonadota bacterium]
MKPFVFAVALTAMVGAPALSQASTLQVASTLADSGYQAADASRCRDNGDGAFEQEFAACDEPFYSPDIVIPGIANQPGARYSAAARASFGNLGVRASTRVAISDRPSTARASAFVRDTIAVLDRDVFLANNPDVEVVQLLLPVTLSGGFSASGTPTDPSGTGGFGAGIAQFNFSANGSNTQIYRREVLLQNGALRDEAPVVGRLGTTTLIIDLLQRGILSEGVTVSFGLSAQVNCGTQGDAFCALSASFFESAVFGAGTLVDQNGSELSGLSLMSGSGFDFLSGYEDSSSTVIPLPASVWLLLAGPLSLFLLRRRRATVRKAAL